MGAEQHSAAGSAKQHATTSGVQRERRGGIDIKRADPKADRDNTRFHESRDDFAFWVAKYMPYIPQ